MRKSQECAKEQGLRTLLKELKNVKMADSGCLWDPTQGREMGASSQVGALWGFRMGMFLKVSVRSMDIFCLYIYMCLLYALERNMLVSMK